MADMNLEYGKVYPDLWMRPGVISDGTLYWQLILLYTDNILAIMEEP